MTKEETEKRTNVMLAYVRGEAIQYYNANAERWEDIKDPLWDGRCEYRVKSKKRVMPYKNGEFILAQKEHGGFIRLRTTEGCCYIATYCDDAIVKVNGQGYRYEELLSLFVWADDNSPCGIIEEE